MIPLAGKAPYLPKLIILCPDVSDSPSLAGLGRSLQLLDVRVGQDLVDYNHIRWRSQGHIRIRSDHASHTGGRRSAKR